MVPPPHITPPPPSVTHYIAKRVGSQGLVWILAVMSHFVVFCLRHKPIPFVQVRLHDTRRRGGRQHHKRDPFVVVFR